MCLGVSASSVCSNANHPSDPLFGPCLPLALQCNPCARNPCARPSQLQRLLGISDVTRLHQNTARVRQGSHVFEVSTFKGTQRQVSEVPVQGHKNLAVVNSVEMQRKASDMSAYMDACERGGRWERHGRGGRARGARGRKGAGRSGEGGGRF